MTTATTYKYEPVLFDRLYDRSVPLAAGTIVRKVQPAGCPRNGTMGQCYVEDAETGEFYGLVCVNSLVDIEDQSDALSELMGDLSL